jgi:hypothetical protein
MGQAPPYLHLVAESGLVADRFRQQLVPLVNGVTAQPPALFVADTSSPELSNT